MSDNTVCPASEVSEEFIQGMRNRMAMSYFKYGKVTDAYPAKVDAIGSLAQRLERYAETGNTEFLMDVANFAMIEFMAPRHPHAYFHATDSDQSPGRIDARTGRVDHRSNDELGTNPRSRIAAARKFGF